MSRETCHPGGDDPFEMAAFLGATFVGWHRTCAPVRDQR